jgi:hypothetical protein
LVVKVHEYLPQNGCQWVSLKIRGMVVMQVWKPMVDHSLSCALGFSILDFLESHLPSFGLYPKMHEIEENSKASIGLFIEVQPY